MDSGGSWMDEEVEGCGLGDARLRKRLRHLLEQMGGALGEPIPFACQDWANTKAAYRFFSNERVGEDQILAGHFASTRSRVAAVCGPILIAHDTTEFSYQRDRAEQIGMTYRVNSGRDKEGRIREHTVCGLLMHSSLMLTRDGLPLGLGAVKLWTRSKFKGTAALKRKINPTRVPIEEKESYRWLENVRQTTGLCADPGRCIHIGDRESDIYELFCLAQELRTHFLIRTCVDRLAGDGTVARLMQDVPVLGRYEVEIRTAQGMMETATVDLCYTSIRVLPPIGKQKRYPALTLTILHAREREEPADRPRLDWKLVTDLPITSHEAALEKLRWYAMRWKIEVFHKILKSGCKAEDARLRTAERLSRLIAVFCILSWRVFWMTMIKRTAPDAPFAVALTELETKLLDHLVPDKLAVPAAEKTLSSYLTKVAQLGGYLARRHDPPPGNIVMWRGLSRLTDILIGCLAGRQLVGN